MELHDGGRYPGGWRRFSVLRDVEGLGGETGGDGDLLVLLQP